MMKPVRRVTEGYFLLACKQYEPLIGKLAFSIGVDSTHAEELRSLGKDELLKCMICYDGRGSFMTFLYGRLSGTFKHMRDAENRVRRIRFIPVDSMEDLAQSMDDIDTGTMVEECMACLTKKEHTVIHELYFGNKTMRNISEEYDIAHSTIWRIKYRALGKMRRLYERCLE